MSKYLYLPFITVLLCSCSAYLPYENINPVHSITAIPLKPSGKAVDCYFNSERPSKPYYKINITEVTGNAADTYNDLLLALKNKAREQGLNAVLVLDKQQEVEYYNHYINQRNRSTFLPYSNTTANTYQRLSAVGIKYADDLDYVDTIPKNLIVEWANQQTDTFQLDLFGGLITSNRAASQFYTDSIEPFDIGRHLQAAVKGWQYVFTEGQSLPVSGFRKLNGEQIVVTASADKEDPAITWYKIFDIPTNKYQRFKLVTQKDAKGNIIKEVLYRKGVPYWEQQYEYSGNTVTGIKRYRSTGGQQQLLFTAKYQFYTLNDLPAAVQP